jgi:hypothetical protein
MQYLVLVGRLEEGQQEETIHGKESIENEIICSSTDRIESGLQGVQIIVQQGFLTVTLNHSIAYHHQQSKHT